MGGKIPTKRRPERDWFDLLSEPSNTQIKTLCETHQISGRHALAFRQFLGDLVEYTGHWLWILRNESSISDNRTEAEQLVGSIDRIVDWLNLFDKKIQYEIRPGREFRFGRAASKALARAAQNNISQVIDPWFAVKSAGAYPSELEADGSIESIQFDFSNAREFVQDLVFHNPEKYLVVLLEHVRRTLSETTRIMKTKTARGGPRPHAVGPWILSNLAEAFVRFGAGRKPSTSLTGPFGRFAVDVVEAMGLPHG